MVVREYAYPLPLNCKRLVLRAAPEVKVNQKNFVVFISRIISWCQSGLLHWFQHRAGWVTDLSVFENRAWAWRVCEVQGCSTCAVCCSMLYFHSHLDLLNNVITVSQCLGNHICPFTSSSSSWHTTMPTTSAFDLFKKGTCGYLVCMEGEIHSRLHLKYCLTLYQGASSLLSCLLSTDPGLWVQSVHQHMHRAQLNFLWAVFAWPWNSEHSCYFLTALSIQGNSSSVNCLE